MPGQVAVIYRVGREDELLFRDELEELSSRRGAPVHYVIGERGGDGLMSPEQLRRLVPDIADRDVYVCGPVSMTEATRASLRRAGVPVVYSAQPGPMGRGERGLLLDVWGPGMGPSPRNR